MPKLSDEFSSGSLKAEELQGRDVTLTIRGAEIKIFKDDGGGPEKKLAVQFAKTDKELICNKTNREIIATLYGDDTDEWLGKKITLYPTRVAYQGKMTNAIRVREWVPGAAAAPAPVAPVQPPPPPRAEVNVGAAAAEDDDDIPF